MKILHSDNTLQTNDSRNMIEMNPFSKVIRLSKKFTLFALLGLSYVFLSYNYFGGWWHSSIGTIAILTFSFFIWGNDFLGQTGLKMKPIIILKSLVAAIILTVVTYLIMKYIADKEEILIKFTNWKSYYHGVFYVLNEEIILGAMPLILLVQKWKLKPIIASVILALLFSVIHFVFYKWLFNDRGIIQVATLITLFFVGIIRNNLIIQTGHIGYSWALHFGWMAVMFGSAHQYVSDHLRVSEPDRFNIYLGSYELLIISGILVGLSIIYLMKNGTVHNSGSTKPSATI
ncbi:type II CAAX prenyl endopeptidase Rce1 family protein [Saccharicrinis sp. FJH2]|uniref:CPBP family glutamic-type intramembrane protease n=1 Tax=Saccharicrinis sp. FJH65 TaxID=3344659 RepID=UPI0035F3781C